MKVKIKCVQAEWIERYSDGMACSTVVKYYPTKKIAISKLKKDYDKSEIDIDTDRYEFGWLLTETELEFDTNDKFDITVIP